jgi:hypothetical protein
MGITEVSALSLDLRHRIGVFLCELPLRQTLLHRHIVPADADRMLETADFFISSRWNGAVLCLGSAS